MFVVLKNHHSADADFLRVIAREMSFSQVDWRCSFCWRTNKANTKSCARCGIKWTHGQDPTYIPQKELQARTQSPRHVQQSSATWNYTGWNEDTDWGDSTWQQGYGSSSAYRQRGSTPRKKTPKQKKGAKPHMEGRSSYHAPPPEPPWNSHYAGAPQQTAQGGEDQSAAAENLALLATALKENNTTVPASVAHIVSENSAPVPTSKSLKNAVDKMDKARKKLKEVQKARLNLHNNWRAYIADSIKRWSQFAEQFAKEDQELADKVKTAQERLQQTKDTVEERKNALEELDADTNIEISDDEMVDKVDSSEQIQANLSHMVENLQKLHQTAEAAIIEAGENKNKRPRLEEPGEGGPSSNGFTSPSMAPFGKPDK